MTHEQKIAFIRSKALEANPNIEYSKNLCETCDGSGCKGILTYKREIRLADILICVHSHRTPSQGIFVIKSDGEFAHISFNEFRICNGSWNLNKDDLSKQTPDTVDFIYNVLK